MATDLYLGCKRIMVVETDFDDAALLAHNTIGPDPTRGEMTEVLTSFTSGVVDAYVPQLENFVS
jgi:hypothetical protein